MTNERNHPWIIWVNQNAEADAVLARIPEAEDVRGSMTIDKKEDVLRRFGNGDLRVLVAKPSMCGFGLNWQHCSDMIFLGLSYSFEQRYQAIRRCWRFGQTRQVNDHVIMSPAEAKIFEKVRIKETKHVEMEQEMSTDVQSVHDLRPGHATIDYSRKKANGNGWTIVNGDCCEEIKHVPDDSMGFSVFSPPLFVPVCVF